MSSTNKGVTRDAQIPLTYYQNEESTFAFQYSTILSTLCGTDAQYWHISMSACNATMKEAN